MKTDGYHLYKVEFIYRQRSYTCEFYSTAEITPNTDKLVAWGIADDAIKERMATIPDRVNLRICKSFTINYLHIKR